MVFVWVRTILGTPGLRLEPMHEPRSRSYLGCGEKGPKSLNLHSIWKLRSQGQAEEWGGSESTLLEVQWESIVLSEVLSSVLTSFAEMLISNSSRTWHQPTLSKVNQAETLWGVKRKRRHQPPDISVLNTYFFF